MPASFLNPLNQAQTLVRAYVQDDAQLSGPELQTLINRSSGANPAVSHQAAEFANPLDQQVIKIVRGQIPGADKVFTSQDLTKLRHKVDLANDPAYANQFAAKVDHAALAPSKGGNAVKLYVNGSEAFPEIHHQIQTAQHTIDMDFYMFEDNSTGNTVADELVAAAKRGVRVNVMVDALSSHINPAILTRLEKAGITVKKFTNGYSVPELHPSTSADHRKLLLIDGKVGMSGGMNLGESYEKYWHDTFAKVEGPAVKDMYHAFTMNWVASGGKMPTDALALAEQNAKPVGDVSVAVHQTAPPKHQIADAVFAAIDAATDHIYMNSPYLIDQPLVDHLKSAAARGVRVVVQFPTKTDIGIVSFFNETRVNELVAAGIEVRTFDTLRQGQTHVTPATDYFDHAKIMTIDGVWSAVGSANASARSMWHNQEINLAVTSPNFAHDVERRFFGNDAISGRVSTGHAIKYNPLTLPARSLLVKASQFLPF